MEIEQDLLCDFYVEMSEYFGEQVMFKFYKLYGGLTLNIPIKMYDSNKIKGYLSQGIGERTISKNEMKKLVQKFNYSERHLRRLLSEKMN